MELSCHLVDKLLAAVYTKQLFYMEKANNVLKWSLFTEQTQAAQMKMADSWTIIVFFGVFRKTNKKTKQPTACFSFDVLYTFKAICY